MRPYQMLFIMFLAFSFTAHAETCTDTTSSDQVLEKTELKTDVPAFLEGATIIVRLKDGKETTVPAERFKVVPRKQQFIVTKVLTSTTISCHSGIGPNRVSALGGYGSTGKLKTQTGASHTEVESQLGAVGGLQYQRNLNDTLSLGVQGQTNQTGSVSVGVDF